MKKNNYQVNSFFSSIFILTIIFFFTSKSFGQETGFIGGIGSAYSFNDDLVGINGRLYYGPNKSFCFGPESSFFLYQEINEEEEIQLIDISFNAHYIFEIFNKFGIYPLSGINYT